MVGKMLRTGWREVIGMIWSDDRVNNKEVHKGKAN